MTYQQLQVEIDKNSGFCFGVVYAISMAEDILDAEGQLYCLGDIVHNDVEVARLKAKGLQIIQHEDLTHLKDAKVLIRAHGEPPSTYELALKNNLELIDASCPVVLKLQNRVRDSYEDGTPILIYGKHGHAEVIGLQGQTQGEATVFMNPDELDYDALPKKVSLFSQTTKSMDTYYAIADKLRAKGIEVDFNDTICRQVSNREPELSRFAPRFKKIIFVAGKKSSNGKVLFEVCKAHNPNTWFISSVEELDMSWIEDGDSIGICGATSTPLWQMEEVRDKILSHVSEPA